MRYDSVSKLQINIKRPGKLFLFSQEFCSSYKVLVSLVKTFLPKHSTGSPSQGTELTELTKGNYFVFASKNVFPKIFNED